MHARRYEMQREIKVTDDYKKLMNFFMENGLEFSAEDPVPTYNVKAWEIYDAGKLIAAAVLAKREGKFIIDGIAVEEAYRKENLGRSLMAEAGREAISLGGDEMYLVARMPGFFNKLGFEQVDENDAPDFFECRTCPQYNVNCFPQVMKAVLRDIAKEDAGSGRMKIVLDGMGGDNAPAEIVKGAVDALEYIEDEICIVGDKDKILSELAKYKYDEQRITIRHASEQITMEDGPIKAIRRKKDSSMVVGLEMIQKGEGGVFVSAGNTGAVLAGALLIVGRIEGIDRPTMASVYPILGTDKPSLLVDAGANSECRADNLMEFGVMGSVYMEKVLGRTNPSIGLVSLGTEDTKGTMMTKAAFELLQKAQLNFIGNIEARDVPGGICDVIVCDGFIGNVILKLTEGLAWNILKLLKKKFTDGLKATIGAVFLKGKMGELKREFDYSEYGGAPILGVRGPVVKMHGSSKAKAVMNTIIKAVPYAKEDVVGVIRQYSEKMEEIRISEEL